MRKFLDTLYRVSGALAAISLAGITVIVFGQVLLNLIDYASTTVLGKSYGLLIPSYSLLSGYALAFATFLSLGLGFRRAAHIRVTLVESRLSPRARRHTLTVVAIVGVAMGALLTYSLGQLAVQSFVWGDRASGLLRIPLWIPQSVLCLGASMFFIAALDTLVEILRRGESDAMRIESPAEESL